jgi:ABC-type glycerol-3-phosphate transport system substrate-binding protein
MKLRSLRPISSSQSGTDQPAAGERTGRRSKKSPALRILGAVLAGTILLAAAAYGGLTVTGFFGSASAVLSTNLPVVAAYVDIFNVSQSEYKIQLTYTDAPVERLGSDGPVPDLVIGEELGFTDRIELFRPLDHLFKEGFLKKGAFYRHALVLGERGGVQYFLPVSFDVPAVILRASEAKEISPLVISTDVLRERAGALNTRNRDGSLTSMGYSPRWQPEYLPSFAALFGTSIRESTGNGLAWNNGAMSETIRYVRFWIDELNGGLQTEDAFREKYLYDPKYKLIRTARIGFSIVSGSEFFLMPEENRSDLDYRWLSRGDRIPVLENIVFIGTPKNSRNRPAAEAFIRWFFLPETQMTLMESARRKQVRTFGITGGLSSVIQVNEQVFPKVYPLLVGHIPPQEYFLFPSHLPSDWLTMKREVLVPWMLEAIAADPEAAGTPTPLHDRIASWRLSREGY